MAKCRSEGECFLLGKWRLDLMGMNTIDISAVITIQRHGMDGRHGSLYTCMLSAMLDLLFFPFPLASVNPTIPPNSIGPLARPPHPLTLLSVFFPFCPAPAPANRQSLLLPSACQSRSSTSSHVKRKRKKKFRHVIVIARKYLRYTTHS